MDLQGRELWTKKEKDEYEFLDSIDVKKYLVNEANVWDVMDAIKDNHDKEYCKQYNDSFGLFNYTNTDDFLCYIKRRYPNIGYRESITYYICNPDYEEA